MVTCPRCGTDADDLIDDVFSLIRCEFCGDTIDATDPDLCDAVDGTAPVWSRRWPDSTASLTTRRSHERSSGYRQDRPARLR
jgi:hypothetical protein